MADGIDFWEIAALLGSLHGFFLGAAIWSHQRGNRFGNRILSVLILLYSLVLLQIVAYWTHWLEMAPHLWGVTAFFPYLFGVLLAGYVRSLEDPDFRPRPIQALHFLPFLICVLIFSPFYLSSSQSKLRMLRASYPEEAVTDHASWISLGLWGLQFVHFLIYLTWCWRFGGRPGKASHRKPGCASCSSPLPSLSAPGSVTGWRSPGESLMPGSSTTRRLLL